MSADARDAVITGIGVVSCHGIGVKAHAVLLRAGAPPDPIIDPERFAPYSVHPMPPIDWSQQIPRRSDQRQMGSLMRLGVFAAGLALDDAGLKDDAARRTTMGMIVGVRSGERDIEVDTRIIDDLADCRHRAVPLNEKLVAELRPTLFLAQLPNLLAGNISSVHKVTGSSKTFMGEESAGISALFTAFAQIRAGQATHMLVGAAYNAEHPEIFLIYEGIQALEQRTWQPLWSRTGGSGIIAGTAAAFLVVESRSHARTRGATVYASIAEVEGDRGPRDGDAMEKRLAAMMERAGVADGDDLLVLSGACGTPDLAARERHALGQRLPRARVRGYSGLTGHAMEAQFPLGVALAALALRSGARIPPFDEGAEIAMPAGAARALVTTVGFCHGEGLAVLAREQRTGE